MSVEKCGLLRPFFNVGHIQMCVFPSDGEKFWSNSMKTVSRFFRSWGRGFAIGKKTLFWVKPLHVASINLYKEL